MSLRIDKVEFPIASVNVPILRVCPLGFYSRRPVPVIEKLTRQLLRDLVR